MEHLTFDQITDFVSLELLDEEARTLIATVNGHVHACDRCRRRVRAFQLIYDEFLQLSATKEFRTYAQERAEQYEKTER